MGTPSEELDRAGLRAIAATDRPLAQPECAEWPRLAAGLIEPGGSTGPAPARRCCCGAMSILKRG
jgi:hypothetical protein